MDAKRRETKKSEEEMLYLAPMEGLTGYIYRNVFHELFGGADRYFTPFIGAAEKKIVRTRDRKEVEPENNRGLNVVPQLLTNRPAEFLSICRLLCKMGYREVNLNTGCPANTVVGRHRGAGILGFPEELDRLLGGIFEGVETDPELSEYHLKISVKTRIGLKSPEEFPELLTVFNRYPLSELIIHARTRKDFYDGTPDRNSFRYALEHSKNPVCYNGDIWTAEDYQSVKNELQNVNRPFSVMAGRGVIADPGLLREIRTGQKTERKEWKRYADVLYQRYRSRLDGDHFALMRMKEIWCYLGRQFPEKQRELKDLKKAKNTAEYESAVMKIFLG